MSDWELAHDERQVTAHQVQIKTCPGCGAENRGVFPVGVSGPVQYGTGFKTWATYFQTAHFIPLARTAQIIEDLTGQRVAQATLMKAPRECVTAITPATAAIKAQLRAAQAGYLRTPAGPGAALPTPTRTYHEIAYRAESWPKAFRVILKAEVMALGDNLRFVVTSLDLPSPECLYRDLYSARSQDENFIKMLKNDLASDRTSDHRFLANHLRLFFSCAAYVLHQALRTEILAHTERAKAQPLTVILKLFKLAVRVVASKDRIKPH